MNFVQFYKLFLKDYNLGVQIWNNFWFLLVLNVFLYIFLEEVFIFLFLRVEFHGIDTSLFGCKFQPFSTDVELSHEIYSFIIDSVKLLS